jgi:type II secretory pathway pseudopilin PulG
MGRLTGEPDDRGETLVELLVAIAIIGITVVALLGGIAASINMSDMHRKEATANAYLRAAAEKIETAVAASPSGYVPCPAAGAYQAIANSAMADGYKATVSPVSAWNPLTSLFGTCTSATEVGVQRITISVASPDSRAVETLSVTIRKPCRPTTEFPGDTLCT